MKAVEVKKAPIECWRCGSTEIVDMGGLDESTIQRYECEDCAVCDSCRHYNGYKCPDWPVCRYEV